MVANINSEHTAMKTFTLIPHICMTLVYRSGFMALLLLVGYKVKFQSFEILKF